MPDKKFVFLYPEQEYFNFQIESNFGSFVKVDESLERYIKTLNACIHERYRRKRFQIFYVLFDKSSLTDVVSLQAGDTILHADITFEQHTSSRENGAFQYPNQDYILDQLIPAEHLRIAGFHRGDCVDKLARRAHERGLSVLVDEDLTEDLIYMMRLPEFKTDEYSTYNARKYQARYFPDFMRARANKPWLCQDF